MSKTQRRKPKTKRHKQKPSKQAVQQAKLHRAIREYEYISSVLQESEKWRRIAEIRNPKINWAKELRKMMSLQDKLTREIVKLRKTTRRYKQMSTSVPGWVMSTPVAERAQSRLRLLRLRETPVPPWVWRDYVRDLAEAGSWNSQDPLTCEPSSVRTSVTPDPTYREIWVPEFPDALVSYGFHLAYNREFDRYSGRGFSGVSFDDMFVRLASSAPRPSTMGGRDGFTVADIFSFATLPAPCDGTFAFEFCERLCVSREPGTVDIKYLVHKQGDGHDVLVRRDAGWSPYSRPFDRTRITEGGINVNENQIALFDVAIRIELWVEPGEYAYFEPPSYYVFCVHPEAPLLTRPGIYYTFEPRSS